MIIFDIIIIIAIEVRINIVIFLDKNIFINIIIIV